MSRNTTGRLAESPLAETTVAKAVSDDSGDVGRHGRQDGRIVDSAPGRVLSVDMEPGDVGPLIRSPQPGERDLSRGRRGKLGLNVGLSIGRVDGADVDPRDRRR